MSDSRGSGVLTAVGLAAGVLAATCFMVAPRRKPGAFDRLDGYRYAHRGLFDEPLSASRYPAGTGPAGARGAAVVVPAAPLWTHDCASSPRPVVPENSLPAFERAAAAGYGAELDVHLTVDGRLAVVHDGELLRVCGRPGLVEKLTATELSEYRLLGTDERVPFLEEVLPIFEAHWPAADTDGDIRERDTDAGEEGADVDGPACASRSARPLIVELKTYAGNHAELTAATLDCLDRFCVPYCIESFDPHVLVWLRGHRPDVVRGQLAADFVRRPGGTGLGMPARFVLTNLLEDFVTRPDFIAYDFHQRGRLCVRLACQVLGGRQVDWTIRSQDDLETSEREGHLAIFERFIPR